MSSSTTCLLFLLAVSFSGVWAESNKSRIARDEESIAIELYYTANSQRDGEFVVSQLSAELRDPLYPNLVVITMSIGPGVSIRGEPDNYSCHDAEEVKEANICATSLLHVSAFSLFLYLLKSC